MESLANTSVILVFFNYIILIVLAFRTEDYKKDISEIKSELKEIKKKIK